ncbi:similar to Saccharomyces cerevisiae YAL017W PSK1 One of two (see also PSK2) PAS domain containing S/T protein kinases [Maudiozyma barnettii]|uniref:non-specific serine/threonine protein kinase n=1 Tax=Maudiozyma barnettii TaxID=61262 RepID=A0A8H2VH50_9SACH|nr:serine/threonine protein kinase PSK1 [Kazachstania barnettii]CAB4255310.1 similar to Saccharomyces cerevisiae YAL017W PSK1 One of two (see also PSK2) PAS domain containing S/T protein kinases [Kazachstania barnettii]CAD1783717.1 similar to Saccharomyces cerevisiae YAL017W PSK1 One of two (see also PSK2) PAS domain containing S/T protein kinases [Kazachstania barnettii]
MPYIGASNSSHTSFLSLKEKHAIKKVAQSASASINNSQVALSEDKIEEEEHHNQKEKSEENSNIKSCNNEQKDENKGVSNPGNPDETVSSVISTVDVTPVSSTTKLPITEKPTYNNINRTKSIDSTMSTLTDVDLQELYNLPNESTHSYSYNPLSPNSLAVRLSILKRSLEIIISNPDMLEDGTLANKNLDSKISVASTVNGSKKLDMPNIRGTNETAPEDNNNNEFSEEDVVRPSRSMSLSVADNIPTYNPSQKWTSPTAALNAFVSNYQNKSLSRKNTDPAIKTSYTMNNINRRSFGGNGKPFYNDIMDTNKNIDLNIPIAHRANSLAFLPKIMSSYNMRNKVSTYNDPSLGRRVTSRISFRQPFRETSNEMIQQPNELSTLSERSNNNSDKNILDQNTTGNSQYISEQRENLINLLDLLNETLEKNTSLRATDLHALSLFNIKKPVPDRGPLDNDSSEDDSFFHTDDDDESENSLRLKRTLLDSLAQPFYERNITYVDGNETLRDELEGFEDPQQYTDTSKNASEDYRRILRTFASTKNSAPQAIFTCSQQYPWQFKAANDLACLIFGISQHVLKALTLLDLIHTDSRNFVLHKILSTEDQELAFTGEIIGIVQPGNDSSSGSKTDLVWASIWAKRKNGLLVCVFEKVPCDYVDVALDLDNYEVTSILKKNNNNILEECLNYGGHSTPKFLLGAGADDKTDEDSDDDISTDTSIQDLTNHVRKPTHILPSSIDKENINKKEVKFANELQYVSTLSQSLADLIDNIRNGEVKAKDDELLPMPVRVSNHINVVRYFTLNHLSSNIPCAVSASLLQNSIKLKVHSLPYIAGLFVIDSQSLQLVSFNRSVSKNMFGLHYSELVNKPISTIIPEFNDMIDYISCNYPELDISLSSNRGLVLTEHFFRKVHADMNSDPEYFYASIGIDGRHRDGSLIKVDIQLRVISSSVSLVWITHSRDVKLDDYQTNANQLSMLKESDLTYISGNSSTVSLSRNLTPKNSNHSIKSSQLRESLLTENSSRSYTASPVSRDRKENFSISTSSTITSQDSKESKDTKENIETKEPVVNGEEINDPEMKRKLDLARMYTKDKTQFVKEGNFKVDQSLIISKIGTLVTISDTREGEGDGEDNNESFATDNENDSDTEEPPTTFLRVPSAHIGAHKHTKKFSDFFILQKMGEGAYGKVNLCLHKKKKYIVVIKMIFKERILVDTWVRDRTLGTIPSEIQIMATLNKKPQENILRLLDFFEDDDYYYIETPIHGETGCIDLFDLIEFKTNMTELEAKLIFKQVVSGIRHLHKQGIVHRDIKDENVIVDSKGFVKLIDFGSATYVKSGPFDVFVGTIDYAAPEVLSGDPYEGKPQDIWAIGILLYTIIFKENPFYNIDEILEGDLKVIQNEDISPECVNLIKKILNRNVHKRPVIEEIYEDPWLVI